MDVPETPAADHDQDLLEDLFRLVVSGQTGGSDYASLDAEIYGRLLQAYAGPAHAGGQRPPGHGA